MEDQARAPAILEAAMTVARESGLAGLTKPRIAELAKCSPALVNHYWGSMTALRDAVVQTAVDRGDLEVIARAMVEKHPIALAAPGELRTAAASSIIGS